MADAPVQPKQLAGENLLNQASARTSFWLLLASFAVCVWGALAYVRMPVELLPQSRQRVTMFLVKAPGYSAKELDARLAGRLTPLFRRQGFDGEVTAADLDTIEAFFDEHESPSRIELSPHAHPSALGLLRARGYGVEQFKDQLVRSIAPMEDDGVSVIRCARLRIIASAFATSTALTIALAPSRARILRSVSVMRGYATELMSAIIATMTRSSIIVKPPRRASEPRSTRSPRLPGSARWLIG